MEQKYLNKKKIDSSTTKMIDKPPLSSTVCCLLLLFVFFFVFPGVNSHITRERRKYLQYLDIIKYYNF